MINTKCNLKYILTIEGTDYNLIEQPSGWEQLDKVRETQLQFKNEGAKLLRGAFYRQGIEADVCLTVKHQGDNIYSGGLDFSKFKDIDSGVLIHLIKAI